jgi:hypothetical protein
MIAATRAAREPIRNSENVGSKEGGRGHRLNRGIEDRPDLGGIPKLRR